MAFATPVKLNANRGPDPLCSPLQKDNGESGNVQTTTPGEKTSMYFAGRLLDVGGPGYQDFMRAMQQAFDVHALSSTVSPREFAKMCIDN